MQKEFVRKVYNERNHTASVFFFVPVALLLVIVCMFCFRAPFLHTTENRQQIYRLGFYLNFHLSGLQLND